MARAAEAVTTIHRFDEIEGAMDGADSRSSLFQTPDFREAFYSRLDQLFDRCPGDSPILSLDVFDTVLLRDDSSELTRFLEIGAGMAHLTPVRNGKPVTPIDGFMARHLGTKASYRASEKVDGCREGSIVEIHQTASRMLTGSDEHCQAYLKCELEYETTRMQPNALMLEYVQHHRSRGGRAILVSDMYLHAQHIAWLLSANGVGMEQFDRLYSSANEKVSKASGHIFPKIENWLSCPAEDFVHVGDSLHGDFKQPKRAGWKALHMPISRPERQRRRSDHFQTYNRLIEHCNLVSEVAAPN
jgi:FMN phosphatase YigB (HAD superfamily)